MIICNWIANVEIYFKPEVHFYIDIYVLKTYKMIISNDCAFAQIRSTMLFASHKPHERIWADMYRPHVAICVNVCCLAQVTNNSCH